MVNATPFNSVKQANKQTETVASVTTQAHQMELPARSRMHPSFLERQNTGLDSTDILRAFLAALSPRLCCRVLFLLPQVPPK